MEGHGKANQVTQQYDLQKEEQETETIKRKSKNLKYTIKTEIYEEILNASVNSTHSKYKLRA